jgi:hypothetical protein
MMAELRKYGVETKILFPLITRDAVDFEGSASHASGDTKISKDEGSFANTSNAFVHEGNGIYSITLTATEMQAARIVVTIIDSATKVWEDQSALVDTYGNASAQHAFDLDDPGDSYQAKVWLLDDENSTTDRYLVVFYKNSEPVVSGITSPTIRVYKSSDGSNLLDQGGDGIETLAQIGALGLYKWDEATGAERIVAGDGYVAKVSATIDGSTRTWYQPIGRDSSA